MLLQKFLYHRGVPDEILKVVTHTPFLQYQIHRTVQAQPQLWKGTLWQWLCHYQTYQVTNKIVWSWYPSLPPALQQKHRYQKFLHSNGWHTKIRHEAPRRGGQRSLSSCNGKWSLFKWRGTTKTEKEYRKTKESWGWNSCLSCTDSWLYSLCDWGWTISLDEYILSPFVRVYPYGKWEPCNVSTCPFNCEHIWRFKVVNVWIVSLVVSMYNSSGIIKSHARCIANSNMFMH